MNKFSLRSKILFLSSFLIAISVVIGGVSFWSSTQVQRSYEEVTLQDVPAIRAMNRMLLVFRLARIELLHAVAVETDAERDAKSIAAINEQWALFEADEKKYYDHKFGPGEEEIFKAFKAAVDVVKADFDRTLAIHAKNPAEGSPEQKEMMRIVLFEIPKNGLAVQETMKKVLEYQAKTIEEDSANADSAAKFGSFLIICFLAIGSILGIVFSYLFASGLAKQMQRISNEISSAAEQTSTGGSQLAASSSQLSTGSTEAAASLEETVASLEELSSMVKMNTGHAQEANGLSQKSKEAAEKGEGEISKLISAMSDIAGGSKKIEDIINVIDDIAFQTNLLALNAAVEAARAGEQGKGFAVVAEAVRNLAQRSSSAAKDISTLIKDNVAKSEHGAKIAGESGTVLKDILTAVKKVADLNGEIATGSQEQANGIEQISKAMNQLDQATQGNAASSEEVAAASEEMSQQALALAKLVSDLRSLVQGAGATEEDQAPSGQAAAPKGKVAASAIAPKSKLANSGSSKVIPFDEDSNSDRMVGNVAGF